VNIIATDITQWGANQNDLAVSNLETRERKPILVIILDVEKYFSFGHRTLNTTSVSDIKH
jgi:hypothetical protein